MKKNDMKDMVTGTVQPKKRLSTESIIAALRQSHGGLYLAARSLGVPAKTLYRRIERERPLQEALKEEREVLLDMAESALRQGVEGGDRWAIAFALRCLGSKRGYTEMDRTVVVDFNDPRIQKGWAFLMEIFFKEMNSCGISSHTIDIVALNLQQRLVGYEEKMNRVMGRLKSASTEEIQNLPNPFV